MAGEQRRHSHASTPRSRVRPTLATTVRLVKCRNRRETELDVAVPTREPLEQAMADIQLGSSEIVGALFERHFSR